MAGPGREHNVGGSRAGTWALIALSGFLGGGSLVAFGGFLALGPWAGVDLELGPASGLGLNALLCLAFFITHSGLLREPVRERLAPLIPRELQSAWYGLLSGASLLLLILLWQPVGPETSLSGLPRIIFRAAFVLALAGFAWTGLSLKSLDALGIEQARRFLRGRKTRPGPLTVRGPYLWVRHPFYLFSLIMIWSSPDISLDRLLFNLLFSAWIVVGTYLEERDLARQFGDDYKRYQGRVPMLIPTKFRPSTGNRKTDTPDPR
jgi:methanethiol S-methyltransferase